MGWLIGPAGIGRPTGYRRPVLRRLIVSLLSPFVAAAAIAVTAASLTAGPALACSCVEAGQHGSVPADFDVFTGTVTQIDDPEGGGGAVSRARPLLVHFAVETVYQGRVAQPQTVSTAASDASCGYPFAVGRRYTVFTQRTVSGGIPVVSLCGGAVAGSIDPATYGLGGGSTVPPPPTGAGSGSRPWAVAAIVVGATAVIAALGVVAGQVHRRRRSTRTG